MENSARCGGGGDKLQPAESTSVVCLRRRRSFLPRPVTDANKDGPSSSLMKYLHARRPDEPAGKSSLEHIKCCRRRADTGGAASVIA